VVKHIFLFFKKYWA